MNLLPRNKSEFSDTNYWNNFFKQRGKKAFEWYGEYQELCVHLHKYMKYKDQALIVGCGNSKLGSDLYDVGFKSITNIDISHVVIKQMKASNCGRPGMEFIEMDALKMSFEDNSFSVVLDKGTLDAMMPDEETETLKRIDDYFQEISRVLRFGGRYLCISLMQQHIANYILRYFTNAGWFVRVVRCIEAEETARRQGYASVLPVFVVVATKFKQTSAELKLMLEICVTSDGVLLKSDSVEDACMKIKDLQESLMICSGLKKNFDPGKEVVMEVFSPKDNAIKYTVTIVDRKKSNRQNKFAAFIIPSGRDKEYLFCSEEGRQELLSNLTMDRMVLINVHQSDLTMEIIKQELSPLITSVAPLCVSGSIPFLSIGNHDSDLANEITDGKCSDYKSTVIAEGRSDMSGHYTISDTSRELARPSLVTRTLIFQNNPCVVQSEATLKLVKTRRGKKYAVDVGILNCQHHGYMVFGASLVLDFNSEGSILLIGLGGGGLAGYLHRAFPNSSVTVVDIDSEMINVAIKYFDLKPDKRMELVIDDGIKFMKEAVSMGKKYDVVMFDVDNKDPSLGINCPPREFVEPSILSLVHSLLSDQGVLVLNLVARSITQRTSVYESLSGEFGLIAWVKMSEEVGQVIYCLNTSLQVRFQSDQYLVDGAASLSNSLKKINFLPLAFLSTIHKDVSYYSNNN